MNKKSKYRQLKNGQFIRLIKPIENNGIKLEPLTVGKIVNHPNQVEANVWFYYKEKYGDKLGLDTSYSKNGRFEGIVLHLTSDSFAIHYKYNEHSNVLISQEKALKIPFFKDCADKLLESNSFKNVNGEMIRQYDYLLSDVLDIVEDSFAEWVKNECETRIITDEEKENGDYDEELTWCFTNEAQDKFISMQDTLELEFAKQSGFYNHFMGGTIED